MKYRKLGKTGLSVSNLSFGASSFGSVFRDINEQEAMRTVHTAIDQGINYIDVSPYYGLTKAERVLGGAIKEIPRDSYYLSTKAGRLGVEEFNFSKKHIKRSLEDSLKRLNTDYVDIFLLHDIEFGSYQQVMEEGIAALEELKQEGKTRYIGVSGLPLIIFEKVLSKAELDVIMTYCHYSLNDTSLLSYIPLLEKRQVGIINASPISMGLLNTRPVADWHLASKEIQETCKRAARFCEEQGTDLAELAIQFSVQNEKIPTTLVSTASEKNILKNISYTEKPINQELLEEVLNILAPIHNKSWPSGTKEWNEEW
ncbi:aldo/keto reductase [Radiobacillus sp. PE A8.2]|uniref:aldo/keto reductase n=1 Tax=Radiobacillus sp. PE A8.2 TaxID=3380349 RepID=UPI00388EA8D0